MELRASLRLDHQLLAVESEHEVHCMLELVAPPVPGMARPPLSLALVIDRSGSMAGPKLETAKACASFLARRLSPTDRLSVITFDDEVRLEFPLQEVGNAQLALEQAIGGIWPGGSTNLSGGWLKGVEQLSGADPSGGPRRVLLLSDGEANVGVVDAGALAQMARAAGDESGVSTTTIGFGDGFDEELLTAMADAGVGRAYFAPTPDHAPAIFAEEFEGLVSLAAQNVSVEIRPGPSVEMLGVLNDFPFVQVAGGAQVQLGDAYSEETRRVVFKLRVPRLASLGAAVVAEVVLRYVSVGATVAAHEVTIPLTVNLVSADEAAAAALDAEVTEEVVVLKAARAQEEARRRAETGDFDGAKALLDESAKELRVLAPTSSRAEELLKNAEILEQHAEQSNAGMFDPGASKAWLYESRRVRASRARKPKEP